MKKKVRIGIIFGGRSAEHEVSLQSAKNVIDALDKNKYEPVLIGIDKKGKWYLGEQLKFFPNIKNLPFFSSIERSKSRSSAKESSSQLVPTRANNMMLLPSASGLDTLDVVLPVLHGPYGEDGTMQGLLKLANIPFVGASVLGSAIGMDKDVMKRLLRDAGISVAKFIVLHRSEKVSLEKIKKQLGLPLFVKPANLGSSVGVSKVRNKKEFDIAVKTAFVYDSKILVEEFINGREIECSVLGNENPIASVPGEIISQHEFYSYDAKYNDKNGAKLDVPAKLPKRTVRKIQEVAVCTFKVLCCEGMARVDCFLTKTGKVYVNELNTIPGFTKISMYPKLWEASGVSYLELMDRLIQLAIKRHAQDSKLKTS